MRKFHPTRRQLDFTPYNLFRNRDRERTRAGNFPPASILTFFTRSNAMWRQCKLSCTYSILNYYNDNYHHHTKLVKNARAFGGFNKLRSEGQFLLLAFWERRSLSRRGGGAFSHKARNKKKSERERVHINFVADQRRQRRDLELALLHPAHHPRQLLHAQPGVGRTQRVSEQL